MAEASFIRVFEEKVVASLPRQYSRSDNKLTVSERGRLSNAFQETWSLLNTGEYGEDLQDQLAKLSLKDVFRIREVAIFIVDNIPESQQREMTRQMKHGQDEGWDEAKFRARVMEVVVACTRCLESKGKDRYSQPDQAPLGLFGIFDQWQEYLEWFE